MSKFPTLPIFALSFGALILVLLPQISSAKDLPSLADLIAKHGVIRTEETTEETAQKAAEETPKGANRKTQDKTQKNSDTESRASSTNADKSRDSESKEEPAIEEKTETEETPRPGPIDVKQLISTLSLEQKIAQLIVADIRTVRPADFKRYSPGSLMIPSGGFPGGKSRATHQGWTDLAERYYLESIKSGKKRSAVPVFLIGQAIHGHQDLQGATLFPHNIALGASGDSALLAQIGETTAMEIATTGIDWVIGTSPDNWQGIHANSSFQRFAQEGELNHQMVRAFIRGFSEPQTTNQHVSRKVLYTPALGLSPSPVLPPEEVQEPVAKEEPSGEKPTDAKSAETESTETKATEAKSNEAERARIFSIQRREWLENNLAALQDYVAAAPATLLLENHADVSAEDFGRLIKASRRHLAFQGLVLTPVNTDKNSASLCGEKDCMAAISAGADMIIASKNWKALVRQTVKQVEKGLIKESRINDALTRVLELKRSNGLQERGPASQRMLPTQPQIIGSEKHRAVARQAVRESLVLLKNNHQVLPLKTDIHLLVAGSHADDIGLQSGGETLRRQGIESRNEDFPGATSILAGIKNQLEKGGGKLTFHERGKYKEKPDAAVLIFGESPYPANESQIDSLDFSSSNIQNLKLLRKLRDNEIPTISVFISGRPRWINAEINASDALVLAWLPGSEGAGVADLLFKNAPHQFDFSGKLAFDWPNNPQNQQPPLFSRGYGLTYSDQIALASTLNEDTEAAPADFEEILFLKQTLEPWYAVLSDSRATETPLLPSGATSGYGELKASRDKWLVEDDALKLSWSGDGLHFSQIQWLSKQALDLSEWPQDSASLSVIARIDQRPEGNLTQQMVCGPGCSGQFNLSPVFSAVPLNQWFTYSIHLSCFSRAGVDLSKISSPMSLLTDKPFAMSVHKIAMLADAPEHTFIPCPIP